MTNKNKERSNSLSYYLFQRNYICIKRRQQLRPYQNYRASPERSPESKGKRPPVCEGGGGIHKGVWRLLRDSLTHLISLTSECLRLSKEPRLWASIMHAHTHPGGARQRISDYEIIIRFLFVNDAKPCMGERILSTTLKKTYVPAFRLSLSLSLLLKSRCLNKSSAKKTSASFLWNMADKQEVHPRAWWFIFISFHSPGQDAALRSLFACWVWWEVRTAV